MCRKFRVFNRFPCISNNNNKITIGTILLEEAGRRALMWAGPDSRNNYPFIMGNNSSNSSSNSIRNTLLTVLSFLNDDDGDDEWSWRLFN